MSSHPPPVPPEQRPRRGGAELPSEKEKPAEQFQNTQRNTAEQGRQGNVKQNTTNQGYQQDR